MSTLTYDKKSHQRKFMKKIFTLSLLAAAVVAQMSCNLKPTRTVSSAPQMASVDPSLTHYHDQKTINTFETIMNEELSSEKSTSFINYINRQRDFYYIAQDLVNQFDKELDHLFKLKNSGKILTTKDRETLVKLKFQLAIAWEFSERNLHEMQDLYLMALETANNTTSRNQLAAKFILRKMPDWMDEGWMRGDQSAIISLSQHLSDVNDDYLNMNPSGRVTSFDRYAKASNEVRHKAYLQSLKFSKVRSKTLIDKFIQKEWQEYKESRQNDVEFAELLAEELRTPQALDVLEPAADGKGHVTGNRFPPNTWALTFDDGPHPTHTIGMYNTLRKNQVHGTFFWLSKNIVQYPQIVKQAAEYGFSRASHSYTHAQLVKLSGAELEKEITGAGDDFAKVIGSRPTLFRCPYGACGGNNSTIRQIIARNNMLHIFWNVDTLDWQDKNPQSIFERAKKQVDVLGRGIVLFHDIHPQSVEALGLLVPYMKNTKKYDIKPLTEIISIVREKPYVSP